VRDGRIAAVRIGVDTHPRRRDPLEAVTLPGLANAHSTAFTEPARHRPGGFRHPSGLAGVHVILRAPADPGHLQRPIRPACSEMAVAGSRRSASSTSPPRPTAAPRTPTPTPGEPLIAAARSRIRITLSTPLPLPRPSPEAPQPPTSSASRRKRGRLGRRRSLLKETGSRKDRLPPVHSYGAVPARELATWRAGPRSGGPRLHVQLIRADGRRTTLPTQPRRPPTRLHSPTTGCLGPRTKASRTPPHGTSDIALLGLDGTGTCMCPTHGTRFGDGTARRGASNERLTPSPSAPTASAPPSSTCSKRPER